MENTNHIIGVDLGGTNIRAGKVVNNEIIYTNKMPTPSDGSESDVMESLLAAIDTCFDANTQSIGIGVPSVVDVEQGIVYDVANIPSWKVVPLKKILENRYHVQAFVNNDANCFALGEKYFGKARNYKNIVGLTIGTGMGSGLIFNGKLYEGKNCGAGEFGCIPYLDSNFEHYCSGEFFASEKTISAYEAYLQAKEGNRAALKMYEEFGYHMGQAIKSILYAYDPEIIVLGGSLSNAYEFFKPAMLEAIQDFAYRNVLNNLKIEVSDLDNSAIYGAAALYLNSTHF